ncbi:hypothetical protein QFZ49_007298 [Streptomyces turgidiscabies]|uniref:Uncharacterized protein n=1 Tax=Streptomyces turgidiscabies TaxID=85558 RepID=A0ABU0RZT1_9ACTN|nr:hypothetical protein [Streptomyces turgidiscabies]
MTTLTASALWESVTGKPGQCWVETLHVMAPVSYR